MRQVKLSQSGAATSWLGFGGSALSGGLTPRASRRLLDAAFASGIRHFDTAPLYGLGDAEACLGEFVNHRRDSVTITTKFGRLPPARRRLRRGISRVARPILAVAPGFRTRASNIRRLATGVGVSATFTADAAAASLERSFAHLGTDYVDLFLMHEADTMGLDDPLLLAWLQEQVSIGRIGGFGVASHRDLLPALLLDRPEYCRLIQLSVGPSVTLPEGGQFIYHGVLRVGLQSLTDLFERQPAIVREWSDATDSDLTQSDVLSSLLLRAVLEGNPEGVVLFSTHSVARVEANAAAAQDPSLKAKALRFAQLITEAGAFSNAS